METIRSRKNTVIRHFRRLGREKAYRRETGLVLCDGEKLLEEAKGNGARIREILLREGHVPPELPDVPVSAAADDVFDFASPLDNSPGPLFTLETPALPWTEPPERVLILENVQDPGNVGTVVRSAAALGADLVVLVGECADPWHPKTVRSAMGALFRQPLWETEIDTLCEALRRWDLPLYGAALSPKSEDVRCVSLSRAAVAVGNEGRGLTRELLDRCRGQLLIPMTPGSESLNAAIAASILLWEMGRDH